MLLYHCLNKTGQLLIHNRQKLNHDTGVKELIAINEGKQTRYGFKRPEYGTRFF